LSRTAARIAIVITIALFAATVARPPAAKSASAGAPHQSGTPTVSNGVYIPAISGGRPAATTTPQPLPRDPNACTVTRSTATTPVFSSAHPRILINHAPTKTCLQQLMTANIPSATRFKAMVDRQLANGNVYAFAAWYAALMYQVSGDDTYATYAVSRVDAFVAAEEALIARGERPTVAYDSYLEVGDKIADVALVYDWCYPFLTAAQRTRWLAYANQAVWNVWNHQQARWGNTTFAWSGWSVDNPVNNYYYSFLRATMLLGLASRGENPQAQGWIDQFRTTKLEQQLFPVFNRDLSGGGSREGTGYGTAMRSLFQLYDWWERSTGERIATRTPHTLASMAHLLHNLTPTLDRLAPTGDHARDETAALFDYHREYLLTLMTLFPDERLSGVAHSVLVSSSVPAMTQQFQYVWDYLYHPPALTPRTLDTLAPAYWGDGTGQLLLRSGWNVSATFANLICGPYTESHAHRDQGSFVLFKRGWLAFDANQISASGIEQAEEMHNLVRITQNGATVRQIESAPPCVMNALTDTQHFAYARADIRPVYNGHAAIGRAEREWLFVKPDLLIVLDRIDTSGANTQRIWTLNTPLTPTINGARISMAQGSQRLDVHRLAPGAADATTQVIGGRRVETTHSAGTQTRFLHVLDTNGTAASAVRSDAAGQTGAQITLTDGVSITVRFSNAVPGGVLTLRDASGAVLFEGALPAGLSAPPVFGVTQAR
jgi:hypothetical protein